MSFEDFVADDIAPTENGEDDRIPIALADADEELEEPFVPEEDDPTAEVIPIEEAMAEAPPTEAPAAEPEEQHLTSIVCDCCLELNLTTKSCIECARCGKPFCYHFASSIDAQYCVNCLSEVTVERSTVTKTYEHHNLTTGEPTFYRRKARDIKISGLDWLFAQRKISELTDAELDLTIEYHRNILQLMIAEQERKRTEYLHRYAGVKVHPPLTSEVNATTVTTTKKVHTVSKTKKNEQMTSLFKSVLAGGITPEQIAAALKKLKK